jgi:hypothetical protein
MIMVSEQATRAMALITGIDLFRHDDADFWRGAVTRTVTDLDAAGNTEGVRAVADMLAETWDRIGRGPEGQEPRPRGGGS